jgi:hypothetical protein
MSEAPKTVWVTKYALTRGIAECRVTAAHWGTLWADWPGAGLTTGLMPSDYRPTREAALTRANEMKAAKIASLKRQIKKLEALEF